MPLVYFMRHGRAEPSAAGGDEARQLTSAGRAELEVTARALARLEVRFEVVLASPLVRAQQTAAILRDALAPSAPFHTVPLLAPNAAGSETAMRQLDEVGGHGGVTSALVVAHAPDIGELVAYATSGHVGGAPAFEVGSIACVHFQGQVRAGAGGLRWFMSPSQLAALSGL